ncbi:hypothetical protein BDA99DRAFT_571589 [Phascolomyces articulosus]|uniref:Uncharacterized protein n=1 Tax=Phascolomyces articulosus TaxID=60185 RepID=A0AAD5PE57_9FUNG|nr:hypothetical protein BDA99DRAFT_571589 [Phascolomyces articulosus]
MSSVSQITITHSQAACAFFFLDPKNEFMCEQEIDAVRGLELCYINRTFSSGQKPVALTHFATKNGAHFLMVQKLRKHEASGHRVERKIVYIMKAEDRAMITRAQATCMFYGKLKYQYQKPKKMREAARRPCRYRHCYLEDTSSEPFLVAKIRIKSSPDRYKQYPRVT